VGPTAAPVAAAEPAAVFVEPGAGAARSAGEVPPGAHVIKSPMVGTFYRSPEPGAPPFVEVGTRVQPDTIVCIIEVMKLMNSVPAGIEGTVTHVLAENAHPVEFGQPLVAIAPVR
jgi:acetyl-CoA carboxylase biotin carboxyl carrier protein